MVGAPLASRGYPGDGACFSESPDSAMLSCVEPGASEVEDEPSSGSNVAERSWADSPTTEADGPELVEGEVEKVLWRQPDGGRVILLLNDDAQGRERVVVGHAPAAEVGLKVEASGRWVEHRQHGPQFSADRIEIIGALEELMIIRRLAQCPGISDAIARRIVDWFGDSTIEVLADSPGRLEEVAGIGAKLRERLASWHADRHGPVTQVEDELVGLGVSARFAPAIVEVHGASAMEVLRTDPYLLIDSIAGIGFHTVDRIARLRGMSPDDPTRLEASLVHALDRARMDGHCALPLDQLRRQARELLLPGTRGGTDRIDLQLDAALVTAVARERVVHESATVTATATATEDGRSGTDPATPDLIFGRALWEAEGTIARTIVELSRAAPAPWRMLDLPDYLDEGQCRVVRALSECSVVVVTGGPGTGKSTVVGQLLALADHNEAETTLCAPTGRAARRLAEATGHSATTIHRLLELRPDTTGTIRPQVPELPAGLVVVDEASMLDLHLAEALMSALRPGHRLVLVGDVDQLPSVGPGDVLRNLIDFGASEQGRAALHIERLTRVHRQSEGSSIIAAAHEILAGRTPGQADSARDGQFFVIRSREPERARERVLQLICDRIPDAYGLDPWTQIQVLCPMHRGVAGVSSLNRAIQAARCNNGPSIQLGDPSQSRSEDRQFQVGDRVLQTRNDHNRGVFNGDIGHVLDIDRRRRMLHAQFDGETVRYEGGELYSLSLAYAMTIHKAQGSEFPAVIIPLFDSQRVMLRRNLIYTAITRATRLCVLVGHESALEFAVAQADAQERHGGLMRRLSSASAAKDPVRA